MPSQAETIDALRKANLPVDPVTAPYNPSDPYLAARMFGSVLGIPDAIRALRGEMTEDEQKQFAMTAALGLIPGAEGLGKVAGSAAKVAEEAAGPAIKTMSELLPGSFKAFPELGKLTPKEYLMVHKDMGVEPPPFVMKAIQPPPKAGAVPGPLPVSGMSVESNPGFGAALKDYVKSGTKDHPDFGLMSDDDIDKYMAKNPGASIFDVAGVAQPKTPAAAKGLQLVPAGEEGDYFIHDPSGKKIAELTYGKPSGAWPNGNYHVAVPDTGFTSVTGSTDEALKEVQEHLNSIGTGKGLPPAPAPVKKDYSQHLQPLNWQNFGDVSASARSVGGVQPPPFPDPETQARAASLGFNTNLPLFKGGNYWGDYPEIMWNPTKKSFERGNFLSDSKGIASSYGHPMPYVARASNPAMVDWPSAVGYSGYEGGPMHDIIEAARGKGHDLLVVKGIEDMGSGNPQNQYVALDPSILRAPTAKFDPTKVGQPWPLAGIAGAAIGTGAASPQISEYIQALQNGQNTP